MKLAYFDCFSGISGDMTLGALIAAGANVEALREGLAGLGLSGWELRLRQVVRHGIAATDVEVYVEGWHEPSRDPGHPHGPTHDQEHSHDHHPSPPGDAGWREGTLPSTSSHGAHGHSHAHETSTEHRPSSAQHPAARDTPHSRATPLHPHRGLKEIRRLIAESALPEAVKEQATAVFQRLGEAEARVHACDVEQIHFHEVGAVDSIVDIVGSVLALHLLGVEKVVCSPLPTGRGFIRVAHGVMPLPAPATMELLRGLPTVPSEIEAELVTPTGAALMATLATQWGPMPPMRVSAIGYGAGKKEFAIPNLLRVCIGESIDARSTLNDQRAPWPKHEAPTMQHETEATTVALLETNLDDLNPQLYGYVMERLFAAGALDVTLTPIQMKKNRPAVTLGVLCEPTAVAAMAEIVFAETSALGVRYSEWRRICLEREWVEVPTEYGAIRVKVGRHEGRVHVVTPEFDDCRRAAEATGTPLKEVQAAAVAAAREILRGQG